MMINYVVDDVFIAFFHVNLDVKIDVVVCLPVVVIVVKLVNIFISSSPDWSSYILFIINW